MEYKGFVIELVHSSPSLDSIPRQLIPVCTLAPFFLNINLIIRILLSTHRSDRWYVIFRFSDQNCVRISHLVHAYYTSRLPRILDLITILIFTCVT
jgi:hypothetical protein